MKILFFIYFIIRLFIFVFPRTYISELFLSFIPYIVILDIFIIIFYILFYLKFKENLKNIFNFQKKYPTYKKVSFVFFCIIIILQLFITIYNIKQIVKSYSPNINIVNKIFYKNFFGLTIFYANIHKNNWTYTGIVNPIKEYNPDVVLLVEYENKHQELLKNFWKKNYPYSNKIYLGDYAGNAIFSKYPIKDLASTINQIPWRFGYISIKKHQKKTFFYLIHTSSPVSYYEYKARNRQLKYLQGIISSQNSLNKGYQTIILGDLNLSPWSPFYSDFVKNIGKKYKNITTTIPLVMTWGLKKIQFPKVHIDHIFMSEPEKLFSIKKINIGGVKHDGYVGSDHDGFIFQIK